MIIPDVNAEKKSTKTIVGLAGHISSGKTTAGNFLKQKGFKYIRYSQILEKLLKDEHQAVSRQSLQDIGNKLNKNQYVLSQMVYECIRDYDKVVIDGLRHPEDFTFFFEKYGFDFKLLFIKSQKKLRKARYSEQNNKNDSFEHADKNDSEKNIKNLIKLSSKIIYNNDSKEIFKEAVLAAIKDSLCH